MSYNRTEQESIILNAAWSMIDDMVNFAIFMPLLDKTENINLMPQTSDTRRLFQILLGDFLSPLVSRGRADLPFGMTKPEKNGPLTDFTFLFYLRRVAGDPELGISSQALRQTVEAFANWLEEDTYIEKVWLPSIEVEVDLTIKRITWLKICGDIAKHSFTRLEGNVKRIVNILSDHGKEIDEGLGYTVLPEFWEWFHTNIFAYHLSTIAEFLNNIRWAIFTYLKPEYARAYQVTGEVCGATMYVFDVPAEITAPLARTMYWDLMNMVRAKPYFPRFSVTEHLKDRY